MTKDQEMLEREFLAFHRGVARGIAVATAARAMGEWGCRIADARREERGGDRCPTCGETPDDP